MIFVQLCKFLFRENNDILSLLTGNYYYLSVISCIKVFLDVISYLYLLRNNHVPSSLFVLKSVRFYVLMTIT